MKVKSIGDIPCRDDVEVELEQLVERALELVEVKNSCVVIIYNRSKDVMSVFSFPPPFDSSNTTRTYDEDGDGDGDVNEDDNLNYENEDDNLNYEYLNNTHLFSRAFFPNITDIDDIIDVITFNIVASPIRLSKNPTDFEVLDAKTLFSINIPNINLIRGLKDLECCSIKHNNKSKEEQENRNKILQKLEAPQEFDEENEIDRMNGFVEIKRNTVDVLGWIGSEAIIKNVSINPKYPQMGVNIQLFYDKNGHQGYSFNENFGHNKGNNQIHKLKLRHGNIVLSAYDTFALLKKRMKKLDIEMKHEIKGVNLEKEKRDILIKIDTQNKEEASLYDALFECKSRLANEKERLIHIEEKIAQWKKVEEEKNDLSIRLCNMILDK